MKCRPPRQKRWCMISSAVNKNYYFPNLNARPKTSSRKQVDRDDIYYWLKATLKDTHGIDVEIRRVEEMQDTLRIHDTDAGKIYLSEALDHINRVFQLSHVLCFYRTQRSA